MLRRLVPVVQLARRRLTLRLPLHGTCTRNTQFCAVPRRRGRSHRGASSTPRNLRDIAVASRGCQSQSGENAVLRHFMIAETKLLISASGVLQLFIHDTVVRSKSFL